MRVLVLVPAHNEAGSLPAVIRELARECPEHDVLVIDDGSTDGTLAVIEQLGVRFIRLPERLGVGSAVRAGLAYAARLGYECAVRVDGDGQHGADDIRGMLAPVREGTADVVIGSRFITGRDRIGLLRLSQRALAVCLSGLTRARVTDPTCGFWAFGPRAVRVLANQHPTGYPEPELRLLLSRLGLTVVERPVVMRPRVAGRTSLTPARVTSAAARVLLALIVVPLRTAARIPR
jgi:glycosyltransferase involved in cell wall biosynthesis